MKIQILTKIKSKDIFKTPNEVYKCIATGEKSIQNRPIIVFCVFPVATKLPMTDINNKILPII